MAVAAVSMGALGVWSATAGAAITQLPIAPDNLVVFPDRDFITVEGFADRQGQSALIEVVRPGLGVVGSAEGVVSGGDVAFEINHPGGYCWGDGTGLNVTPDIKGGDEVTINFGGGPVEYSVTTQAAAVTGVGSYLDPADLSGRTLKLEGYIAPGFDTANFEQRIVEPALRDTEIARRDIRALFGDLTPDPRGTYQSGVVLTAPNHWVATYVFQDASTAAIADAAIGERAMTWELTDPAANRQGLTIAEFGEPGGPGMGGCPNGPAQSGPPAPENIVATVINGGDSIQVDWAVPTPIPGTPLIEGYRIMAIGEEAGGEKVELGKSITNPAATSTIISGFGKNGVAAATTFRVFASSLSSAGYTFPAAPATLPLPDTTAPVPAASVATGSYPSPFELTLTADDPNAEIYFTLDGTSPLDTSNGPASPALAATLYTAPIPVSAATEVRFAAFDLFGNASNVQTVTYQITNEPTAGTPVVTSITPGLGDVSVAWNAADPIAAGATIANYDVRVYDTIDGVTPVAHLEVGGGITNAVVAGLLSEHDYWVAVAAKNSVNPIYGAESERGSFTTIGVTANAGPDQVNISRPSAVVLSGTGSAGVGVTYKWTQVTDETGLLNVAGGDLIPIANSTSLTANITVPAYTVQQTVGPRFFKLTVTRAGMPPVSDVVKITPVIDPIGITSARWKATDFRIVGTGGIDGATITLFRQDGSTLGTATVALGAWEVRLRNGTGVVSNVFAISNRGGRTGLVPVTTR